MCDATDFLLFLNKSAIILVFATHVPLYVPTTNTGIKGVNFIVKYTKYTKRK